MMEQDNNAAPDEESGGSVQQQQQQPQPTSEGHAGQGAESALKHLRAWEQRRATNSAGKRQGPQ